MAGDSTISGGSYNYPDPRIKINNTLACGCMPQQPEPIIKLVKKEILEYRSKDEKIYKENHSYPCLPRENGIKYVVHLAGENSDRDVKIVRTNREDRKGILWVCMTTKSGAKGSVEHYYQSFIYEKKDKKGEINYTPYISPHHPPDIRYHGLCAGFEYMDGSAPDLNPEEKGEKLTPDKKQDMRFILNFLLTDPNVDSRHKEMFRAVLKSLAQQPKQS